jgi:hypothetical protein
MPSPGVDTGRKFITPGSRTHAKRSSRPGSVRNASAAYADRSERPDQRTDRARAHGCERKIHWPDQSSANCSLTLSHPPGTYNSKVSRRLANADGYQV